MSADFKNEQFVFTYITYIYIYRYISHILHFSFSNEVFCFLSFIFNILIYYLTLVVIFISENIIELCKTSQIMTVILETVLEAFFF